MTKSDASPQFLRFSKDQPVFREGDDGELMYFIHSGSIRIEVQTPNGPKALGTLTEGDFFGEMALIDRSQRTASAIAEEDALVLPVDSERFERLVQSNVEIAIRIIRKYVHRLKEANVKLQSMMAASNAPETMPQLKAAVPKEDKKENALKLNAHFRSESNEGFRYKFTKEQTTLGRYDPVTQINPDLDLTTLDGSMSTSRRHARIDYVHGTFFLTEEIGVSNGTQLNGKAVTPGKPTALKDGDVLQLGQVKLVFCLGHA